VRLFSRLNSALVGKTGRERRDSNPRHSCVTGQHSEAAHQLFYSANSSRLADFSEARVQHRCAQSPKVTRVYFEFNSLSFIHMRESSCWALVPADPIKNIEEATSVLMGGRNEKKRK
jgi:hypothetical protein